MEITLNAKGVSLTYPNGTVALKAFDLEIEQGDLVFITGHSGSGKTSMIKLFMGTEFSSQGELEVMGQVMKKGKKSRIQKVRRQIGPIFQEFKLIDGRTAMDNVMLGMRFLGVSPRSMREEASLALEKVGLGHKKDSLVEHLSWGEAQRVAIARAVVRKPAIILADEPTGNLDHKNAVHILELLKSFRDYNTTVIITTHATHLIEEEQSATFIHVKQGEITVERRD